MDSFAWEAWQLLASIGVALALAEFFTPSFFSLPAGLAFIFTACFAAFIEGWTAIYLILAVNLLVVYTTFYLWVWPKLRKTAPKSAADAMAGKIATVSEVVDPKTGAGEVKLYGDTWRVIARESFSIGDKVLITGTEGNKVIIKSSSE